MKLGKVVLAFGIAAAAALGTVDASACLRAMEQPAEKKDDTPRLVAEAERALESGKLAVATATVLKKFPRIKTEYALEGAVDPLRNRASRIVALASVRSDGAFGIASGAAEAKKKANLDWSVAVLRGLSSARAGDASMEADYAEALAKTPAGQEEALKILGRLAGEDLIGSPHAYAALAKLRANAGDAQKSAEAVKRCETMTTTPAICQPKGAPAAVPAKVKTAAPVAERGSV